MLKGGAGNDNLNGGAGNDRLIGGAGNDKFVFDTAIPAKGVNTTNVDRIADFNVGNDTIQLDNADLQRPCRRPADGRSLQARHSGADAATGSSTTGPLATFLRRERKRRPVNDQVKFAHLDKAAGAALFPAVSLADLFVI